jgi:hypothetical protein
MDATSGTNVIERSWELFNALDGPCTVLSLPARFANLDRIADLWEHWGDAFLDPAERERVARFTVQYLDEIYRSEEFAVSPEAFAETLALLTPADGSGASPVLFTATRHAAVSTEFAAWGNDVMLGILLEGHTLRVEGSFRGDDLLVRSPAWVHDLLRTSTPRVVVGEAFPLPTPSVVEALLALWEPSGGPYADLGEALLAATLLGN